MHGGKNRRHIPKCSDCGRPRNLPVFDLSSLRVPSTKNCFVLALIRTSRSNSTTASESETLILLKCQTQVNIHVIVALALEARRQIETHGVRPVRFSEGPDLAKASTFRGFNAS